MHADALRGVVCSPRSCCSSDQDQRYALGHMPRKCLLPFSFGSDKCTRLRYLRSLMRSKFRDELGKVHFLEVRL